jgi:hypothetical protein
MFILTTDAIGFLERNRKELIHSPLMLREQPADTYVLKKADRLVRSAGSVVPAN